MGFSLNWQQRKKDLIVCIDFLIIAALFLFASVWAWNEFITSPPYVDPERYPIRGFDVSSHNGDIDFEAAVADGMDFVFIKATEGVDFRDRNFFRNHEEAKKAGLKTGAYHFFRFDRDGVAQAINLLTYIGKTELELGIVVDVEKQGNPEEVPMELVKERLVAMADYLNLRGYRVMFYTNRDGYYDFIEEDFKGYPLWICGFSSTPISTEWTFWQYDHHGKLKGVHGDVDLDTFYGNRKEWEEYLKKY